MNSETDLRLSNLFKYPPLSVVKNQGNPALVYRGDTEIPPGIVGIEIEAEGISYNLLVPAEKMKEFDIFWFSKEERSLRDKGREFVTYPLWGDDVPRALQVLLDYEAVALKTKMKFNDRTGIHVHMNVQDFFVSEILSFYSVFALFERDLLSLSGGREDNIFCLPLKDSVSGMRELHQYFSSATWESVGAVLAGGSKYLGLNYKNVPTLGTIEFRQMAGTHDFSKIVDWVNLILRMRGFVKSQYFPLLENRIFELNSDSTYLQFAEEVFKEQVKLFTPSVLPKNMAKAVSLIKTWAVSPQNLYVQDRKKAENAPVKKSLVGIRRDFFDFQMRIAGVDGDLINVRNRGDNQPEAGIIPRNGENF